MLHQSSSHGRRRLAVRQAAALTALSLALPAFAQTHVDSIYNGGAGNWSDAANWTNSPAVGSYPNNTASFNYDATVNSGTVSLTEDITVNNFTLANFPTELNGTGDFTTLGKLTMVNEPLFTGSGAINANGGFDIGAGGGSSRISGRTLTVAANTVSDWNNALVLQNNASLILNGTTNIYSGGNFDWDGTGVTAVNNGIINNNAAYRSEWLPKFSNYGVINVNAGSFQIFTGGTHSGAFHIASGTQLDVDGDFTPTATVSGVSGAGTGTANFLTFGPTVHAFHGTVDLGTDGHFARYGGNWTFASDSTLTSLGHDMTLVSGSLTYFDSPSPINVASITTSGGIYFRGGDVTADTITIQTAGNIDFNAPTRLTANTLNVSGGVLGEAFDYNSTGVATVNTLNFDGGGIQQKVQVTGVMNYTSGVIFGTYGEVDILPGAVANVPAGGVSVSQNGTFEILGSAAKRGSAAEAAPGQLNWAGGDLSVGSFATLNNGGILSTTTDGSITNTSGVLGTVANSGTFLKTTATGTTHIAPTVTVLNSNGKFDIESGTVAIDGTLTSSANSMLAVSGTGVLQLDGTASTTTLLVASDAASFGNLNITGGTTTVTGVLGVGNNGSLNATPGSAPVGGHGNVNVSAGQLTASTILLGGANGAAGQMTISGSGKVTVEGGLSINDVTINSGTLTVTDQDPPAGEDPVLNRAIVGGYLHDGAMFVNGGVTTSPFLKLGLSAGSKGSFSQAGGSVSVGTFTLGSDATASTALGYGTMSNGTLSVGTMVLGSSTGGGTGTFSWNGGTLNASALTINRRGLLTVAAGGNRNMKLASLAIDPTTVGTAAGGMFDLSDNDLIVGSATSKATIEGYVRTARDAGQWDRPGLTSSAAKPNSAALKPTGLGVLSGAEYASVSASNTTFDGLTFSATDTLIKYTYNGDADFSGRINADDYSHLDSGFQNQHSAGYVIDWFHGDFDYSGAIDANDYALIDSAYQQQSGTLREALAAMETGVMPDGDLPDSLREIVAHYEMFGEPYASAFVNISVPEPSVVGIGFVGVGLLRRRRRSGHFGAHFVF